MLVRPSEEVPIARLLTFLEQGERMAQACAKAQAALVADEEERRFLFSQSRQEAGHAMIFQGAIAWLAPKRIGTVSFLPAMEEYRKSLTDALRRKALLETFLAEQVILEGLGEAVLARIDKGLAKRSVPFGRLRRILIHQEEAHHAFGCRQLRRAVDRGDVNLVCLREQAQEYLGLADTMIHALSDLFDAIDEDAALWAADVPGYLPSWLTEGDRKSLGAEMSLQGTV